MASAKVTSKFLSEEDSEELKSNISKDLIVQNQRLVEK